MAGSASSIPTKMQGLVYLGDHRVEIKTFDVPKVSKGKVLLKTKASSICGSDLHAIYKLNKKDWRTDQEGYFGVIGGHEPAGEVVALGEDVDNVAVGDRCIVFHVGGCYKCLDCSEGRYCAYTTPLNEGGRRAYGWQRDGGMGDYILCDKETLIKMPPFLTYLDGAMISCGFGTAYSSVMKVRPTGHDRVFIVGLGPVGLSIALICQKMGAKVYGYELVESRKTFALSLGVEVLEESQVEIADDGVAPRHIGYDITYDVTGSNGGRVMAVRAAKRWGTTVYVGGYGEVTLQPSPWILQKQLTIRGSWVCSTGEMRALCEQLEKWQLHPDILISHKFSLQDGAKAFETFDKGAANKCAIVYD